MKAKGAIREIRRIREEMIEAIKDKAKDMEQAAMLAQAENMFQMVSDGATREEVAKVFRVGIATVQRRLRFYTDYHKIERKADGRIKTNK
ncbi:hypothetical protein ACNDMN_004994 [Escherichia coli]